MSNHNRKKWGVILKCGIRVFSSLLVALTMLSSCSSSLLPPYCFSTLSCSPPCCHLLVASVSLTSPCSLHLVGPVSWSPCCPLLIVSSYSWVYRLGESSLIGRPSADRLTNSLFINGLSVPGSQRSQRRTIQFSSIDFMSPCRAIFITGIKTLIKDKK